MEPSSPPLWVVAAVWIIGICGFLFGPGPRDYWGAGAFLALSAAMTALYRHGRKYRGHRDTTLISNRMVDLGLPPAVFDVAEGKQVHEVLDFVCKRPEDFFFRVVGPAADDLVPLWQTLDESVTAYRLAPPDGAFIKIYLGRDARDPFTHTGRDRVSGSAGRRVGEVEVLGTEFQCALADLFVTLLGTERDSEGLEDAARLMGFEHFERMLKEYRGGEAVADLRAWRRRFIESCDTRSRPASAEAPDELRVPPELYRSHPDTRIFHPSRKFPEGARKILERNVPVYHRLDAGRRQTLEALSQVFVERVPFEGCGGLILTNEVRLTVAAQACLLLLGRRDLGFPRLRSVLVYPTTYLAGEDRGARLGESWSAGYVVLAWDSVLQGAADFADGHNVVLHEFAHQLDQSAGEAQGVPVPLGSAYFDVWSRVIDRHYTEMVERRSRGEETVLDEYGATNRKEFFAVATECFFEKARALHRQSPELYGLLRDFYGLDAEAW